MLAYLLTTILLAALAMDAHATSGIGRGDRYVGEPWGSRSPVVAQNGMVASEQPLASQVGIRILQKGGSAVDAAIAVNAVLGVMQPTKNGIGGDAFAIVWDPKTHQLYGYNGSGPTAAATDLAGMKTLVKAARARAGLPDQPYIPLYGPLSISVPGAVDTWFALHQRFGKLPISEDLAPAIAYAKSGFPVTALVAKNLKLNMGWFEEPQNHRLIGSLANTRHTYLIDGHTPRQGEIFRNSDLAHTLSLIARGGRDAFYKGPLAHTMAQYLERVGGVLRYPDFANFHGEWGTPRSVDYRGYDVYELPPNGQGFAVLEMLNIIKGFDLQKMGLGSADALNVMLEAKRLVFEDVARYYADPKFYNVPMAGLLSAAYADQRRKLIHIGHVNPDIGPGNPRMFQSDTTVFETADRNGMMVSYIQSNYHGMGSGNVPDGLGFMFQDRGQLFSLNSADADVYASGKRPFHTLIPGFVMKDGKPWLAFGLMGGSMQAQGHVQLLTDMIDFGLNVQQACDAARWRHSGSSQPTGQPRRGTGTVRMESGFDPAVVSRLRGFGYRIEVNDPKSVATPGVFGECELIYRDPVNHVYWGASDPRKDSEAIGY